MSDNLLLVAVRVREDADLSGGIEALFRAVAKDEGAPAHLALRDVSELTVAERVQLTSVLASENPAAFQTLEDVEPRSCDHCGNLGLVHWHGGSPRAQIKTCSVCSTGEIVARNVGPHSVTTAEPQPDPKPDLKVVP